MDRKELNEAAINAMDNYTTLVAETSSIIDEFKNCPKCGAKLQVSCGAIYPDDFYIQVICNKCGFEWER